MRVLVQRVRRATVTVDSEVVGRIGRGLLLFLGVRKGDGAVEVERLADKVLGLRIFPDERHSMNRALGDIGGEVLLVSQFTLYADCRRGRRPSFEPAELPERAEELYRSFASALAERGFEPRQGVFGADMRVESENDGPVTILLDSDELARPRGASATPTSPGGA